MLDARRRADRKQREVHMVIAITQFFKRLAEHFFFFALHVRYHIPMKTPPDTPEFREFTGVLRQILKVSKPELDARIAAQKKSGKRLSKPSASRVPVVPPKRAV